MPVAVELLPVWMQKYCTPRFEEKRLRAIIAQVTESAEERHTNARERMLTIDALPVEIRLLIHEYGSSQVKLAIKNGCKTRRDILRFIQTKTLQENPLSQLF